MPALPLAAAGTAGGEKEGARSAEVEVVGLRTFTEMGEAELHNVVGLPVGREDASTRADAPNTEEDGETGACGSGAARGSGARPGEATSSSSTPGELGRGARMASSGGDGCTPDEPDRGGRVAGSGGEGELRHMGLGDEVPRDCKCGDISRESFVAGSGEGERGPVHLFCTGGERLRPGNRRSETCCWLRGPTKALLPRGRKVSCRCGDEGDLAGRMGAATA